MGGPGSGRKKGSGGGKDGFSDAYKNYRKYKITVLGNSTRKTHRELARLAKEGGKKGFSTSGYKVVKGKVKGEGK